jgi:L-asparagine transporter-like permease
MELDDIKKIWDSQNNEYLYAINEKALHDRIRSRRKKGDQITNISEWLGIISNIGAGCVILTVNFFKPNAHLFLYLLAAWMFILGIYILVRRNKRVKGASRFDRSIGGDLNYAIEIATYQVRLSQIMRWNILPVGLFVVLGLLDAGKSIWVAVAILIFFVLTTYAAGWEHRIYKRRKRELEVIKNKLEKE